MAAVAHYQLARLGGVRTLEGEALLTIGEVLAAGTVDTLTPGADTVISFAGIPERVFDITHRTIALYVEALAGTVFVRRHVDDLPWRILEGSYVWFSYAPGQDLIMRSET